MDPFFHLLFLQKDFIIDVLHNAQIKKGNFTLNPQIFLEQLIHASMLIRKIFTIEIFIPLFSFNKVLPNGIINLLSVFSSHLFSFNKVSTQWNCKFTIKIFFPFTFILQGNNIFIVKILWKSKTRVTSSDIRVKSSDL